MNWYKKAQTANFDGLVNAIYQRLLQAENFMPDAEDATDDINSFFNGLVDIPTLNNAINVAIHGVVGPTGNEAMLTDAQKHVVLTLRGQTPQPQQQPDMGNPQDPMQNEQPVDMPV